MNIGDLVGVRLYREIRSSANQKLVGSVLMKLADIVENLCFPI